MLEKAYVATGKFPEYGNSGTQLNVDSDTGAPTKTMPSRKTNLSKKIIRFRHGLEGPINFYAVTKHVVGMLIMVSDGEQTRFSLETSDRRHAVTYDVGVKSFEDGWYNLYTQLLMDSRPVGTTMHNVMSRFFVDLFSPEFRTPIWHTHLVGTWRGHEIDVMIEAADDTPPASLTLMYIHKGERVRKHVRIRDHLLKAYVKR